MYHLLILLSLVNYGATPVHARPAIAPPFESWDISAAECDREPTCLETKLPGGESLTRWRASGPVTADTFSQYAAVAREQATSNWLRKRSLDYANGLVERADGEPPIFGAFSMNIAGKEFSGNLRLGKAAIATLWGGLVFGIGLLVKATWSNNSQRVDIEPSNPAPGKRGTDAGANSLYNRIAARSGDASMAMGDLQARQYVSGCVVFQECWIDLDVQCLQGDCDAATVEPWDDEDEIAQRIGEAATEINDYDAATATVMYSTNVEDVVFDINMYAHDSL